MLDLNLKQERLNLCQMKPTKNEGNTKELCLLRFRNVNAVWTFILCLWQRFNSIICTTPFSCNTQQQLRQSLVAFRLELSWDCAYFIMGWCYACEPYERIAFQVHHRHLQAGGGHTYFVYTGAEVIIELSLLCCVAQYIIKTCAQ